MRHRSNRRGKKEDGGKRALKALAAAGAIGAGTQAYAVPVRFENPPHGEAGHFHWAYDMFFPGLWLDVQLPAGEQSSAAGASSLDHWFLGSGSTEEGYLAGKWSGGANLQDLWPYYYPQVVGVGAGESIPSGFLWYSYGFTNFNYGGGYESLLPEGVPTYLGVRFNLGAGNQYGWIGVVRTGAQLEAFAWGHETDPGVPIAAGAAGADPIPTVSEWGLFIMSLGLLAAGAWVAKKRTPQKAQSPTS